jgi:hypothetical protein
MSRTTQRATSTDAVPLDTCPDLSVRAGIGISAWHTVEAGYAQTHAGLDWEQLGWEELVVIAGRAMFEVYRHIEEERAS